MIHENVSQNRYRQGSNVDECRVKLPVVTRADLIAAGDQSGCAILRSATIPETCGVAIEVPESKAYPFSWKWNLGAIAANMSTPGAATSG